MGDGLAPIRDGTADTTDVAVVGIVDDMTGATCTGALIAPDLVLTAQHCVAPIMNLGECTQGSFGPPGAPTRFYVTTRPTMTFNPADYHATAEVVLPPGTGFCGRDIALLRLGAVVPANEAAPIAPRLEPAPAPAELYAAVGYGATDDMGTGSGERRRRDGLAVDCVGAGCSSTFLSVEEWRGEAGVCQGDSGGPALDGSGAVIGVASRGAVGCIAPTYTQVAAHDAWLIDEAVRAANLGGYPPPPWTGVAPPVDAGVDAPIDAPVDAAPGADAGTGVDDPDGGGCCSTGGGDPGSAVVLAIAVILAVLMGAGCGGKELTCEHLADPGNCWAQTAAALRACLPAGTAPGTLASDRASCSFPDGTRILFEGPLPTDNFALERFAFTIERGGATCGSFVDTFMNRMEVSAGGLSAVSQLHPDREFELSCGGDSYTTEFDTLFECAQVAPTDGFEVTPTSVSFTIVSATTPGELFRCVP